MDANPVLVDSSWYIHCLRNGKDPLPPLAVMAASRDLVSCGVVCAEVSRGIKIPKARARFKQFCNAMIQSPCDTELWDHVEETLWTLDKKGCPLPLTDVFIASSALRTGATVLTLDQHFSLIPNLPVIHITPREIPL